MVITASGAHGNGYAGLMGAPQHGHIPGNEGTQRALGTVIIAVLLTMVGVVAVVIDGRYVENSAGGPGAQRLIIDINCVLDRIHPGPNRIGHGRRAVRVHCHLQSPCVRDVGRSLDLGVVVDALTAQIGPGSSGGENLQPGRTTVGDVAGTLAETGDPLRLRAAGRHRHHQRMNTGAGKKQPRAGHNPTFDQFSQVEIHVIERKQVTGRRDADLEHLCRVADGRHQTLRCRRFLQQLMPGVAPGRAAQSVGDMDVGIDQPGNGGETAEVDAPGARVAFG
jgi:hypothetical protein